jgi:hypothetical protein
MDGVTYLRTDDKRGWLFAYHPKLELSMLEAAPGDYIIEAAAFRCDSSSGQVPIREGPGLLSRQCGDSVFPGEEVYAVARWIPNDSSEATYLKLSDDKGWVQMAGSNMQETPLFVKI